MSEKSRDVPVYTQAQIEFERDRMIEVVIKAIVADISSDSGIVSTPGFIKVLQVKSRYQERHLRWIKNAANLALTELYAFFADLDTSLSEVVEAIEYRRTLDESLVVKIKKAISAWSEDLRRKKN